MTGTHTIKSFYIQWTNGIPINGRVLCNKIMAQNYLCP